MFILINEEFSQISEYSVSQNLNPLSANPIKWLNTIKQYVGKLPTNYLSVFDHLSSKYN